jgi:hypothetical protein
VARTVAMRFVVTMRVDRNEIGAEYGEDPYTDDQIRKHVGDDLRQALDAVPYSDALTAVAVK